MTKRTCFLSVFVLLLVAVLLCCPETAAWAQCPMCKAAAESNLKEGGKHALGLNSGILYLLVTPYLIALYLGYKWWKNNRQVEAQQ